MGIRPTGLIVTLHEGRELKVVSIPETKSNYPTWEETQQYCMENNYVAPSIMKAQDNIENSIEHVVLWDSDNFGGTLVNDKWMHYDRGDRFEPFLKPFLEFAGVEFEEPGEEDCVKISVLGEEIYLSFAE